MRLERGEEGRAGGYGSNAAGTAGANGYVLIRVTPMRTVTFNTNGNPAFPASAAPAASVVLNGLTAAQPVTNPTRTGYMFGGWTTTSNGTIPFNFSTRIIEDLTLYAIWNPTSYKITYNLNDGVFSTAAPPTTFTNSALPLTLPTSTKVGYVFDGWFDNVNLTGTKITSITTGGDKTFWAKWALETYTITYNNLNGAAGGGPTTYNTLTGATLPTNLTTPQTGYTFGGWFEGQSLTGNPMTQIPTGSFGNKTLWARWIPIEYTITYMTGNDINIVIPPGTPLKYTVETQGVLLYTPTQAGYTFGGWFDNAAASGVPVTSILAGSTGNKEFWPGPWTSGIAEAERVIPDNPNSGLSAVVPSKRLSGGFTAGPNPVAKSFGKINLYYQGQSINNGSVLWVYDGMGNVIRKLSGGVSAWDLKDSKGNLVPEGTYLIKGMVKTAGGKNEKVSLVISVR